MKNCRCREWALPWNDWCSLAALWLKKYTLCPFINPPMDILCGKANSVLEFNWNEKQMIQLKIKTERSFKCLLSINQFGEPWLTTSIPHWAIMKKFWLFITFTCQRLHQWVMDVTGNKLDITIILQPSWEQRTQEAKQCLIQQRLTKLWKVLTEFPLKGHEFFQRNKQGQLVVPLTPCDRRQDKVPLSSLSQRWSF